MGSEMCIRDRYDTGSAQYKTDSASQEFPGNLYTTDRYMPVPYNLTMQVDIWTGNTDQKLQLMEQILVLFNPSIQLQNGSNPIDWTSIFEVELTDINWSNRSMPSGVDETIDISTLTFTLPIWISPPAKVKRQKIINTIITNIYDTSSVEDLGYDEDIYDFFRTIDSQFELHTLSPNNYFVELNGTEATLFKTGPTVGTSYDDGETTKANWNDLLESISPQGASGTLGNASIQMSDIPLTTGSTLQLNLSNDIDSVTNMVSGFIARNSIDPAKLVFTVDSDTLPTATLTVGDRRLGLEDATNEQRLSFVGSLEDGSGAIRQEQLDEFGNIDNILNEDESITIVPEPTVSNPTTLTLPSTTKAVVAPPTVTLSEKVDSPTLMPRLDVLPRPKTLFRV